jgi:general secretion pathway protein G
MIGSLRAAVELYRADHGGRCPRHLGDLLHPSPDAPGELASWKGPYLSDVSFVPRDPWGHPFVYRVPGPDGAFYEILSLGEDGYLSGEGDAEDLSSLKR